MNFFLVEASFARYENVLNRSYSLQTCGLRFCMISCLRVGERNPDSEIGRDDVFCLFSEVIFFGL